MTVLKLNTSPFLSKNFRASEFACKCGCGLCRVDQGLVVELQLLRDLYTKPLVITSGVRCAKHNKLSGGAENSYHIAGPDRESKAVDIHCNNPQMRATVLKFALQLGFGGIGIASTYLHLDLRHGEKLVWVY